MKEAFCSGFEKWLFQVTCFGHVKPNIWGSASPRETEKKSM